MAWVAQLVERVLGKDEVTGSIPVPGSRFSGSEWRGGFTKEFLEETSGGNSTVESHSSKVMVAGSNPVPRSKISRLALANARPSCSHKYLILACGMRAMRVKENGQGEIRAQ